MCVRVCVGGGGGGWRERVCVCVCVCVRAQHYTCISYTLCVIVNTYTHMYVQHYHHESV